MARTKNTSRAGPYAHRHVPSRLHLKTKLNVKSIWSDPEYCLTLKLLSPPPFRQAQESSQGPSFIQEAGGQEEEVEGHQQSLRQVLGLINIFFLYKLFTIKLLCTFSKLWLYFNWVHQSIHTGWSLTLKTLKCYTFQHSSSTLCILQSIQPSLFFDCLCPSVDLQELSLDGNQFDLIWIDVIHFTQLLVLCWTVSFVK